MQGICGIQFINLSLLFVMISMNTENFLNVFGVLQGPYKEMNAAWFIQYGTMVVQTMILEIPIPHGFPCLMLFVASVRRLYDRRGKSDKSISRMYIQSDYEELYVGAEFLLDSRLAQIIAVVWVTFIYSPALPLLLPLAVVNFSIIYWVDKTLVLRFFRTPKNYDERIINKQISYLKLTFPFHLIGGLFFLSNNGILQSDSFENKNTTIIAVNKWSVRTFGFNILSDQFQSAHLISFITVQMILMTYLAFAGRIHSLGIQYLPKMFTCCKKLQEKIDDTTQLHENYYEFIDLQPMLNERRRAKIDIENIQ